MKTRILFLAFAVLLSAKTVLATETPKTEILSAQGDKILVNYQTDKPCMVEVSITDVQGALIHEWKTENPENCVKRLFNLKEMKDGTYNISLKTGTKSLNSVFNIDGKTIDIGPLVEMYEPYFVFKNDKLYVSFLNQSMKHVFVNVYKDGEHYTGFDFGKNLDIQKCIDFSMAKKGNYEIVLSESLKAHNYTVQK